MGPTACSLQNSCSLRKSQIKSFVSPELDAQPIDVRDHVCLLLTILCRQFYHCHFQNTQIRYKNVPSCLALPVFAPRLHHFFLLKWDVSYPSLFITIIPRHFGLSFSHFSCLPRFFLDWFTCCRSNFSNLLQVKTAIAPIFFSVSVYLSSEYRVRAVGHVTVQAI